MEAAATPGLSPRFAVSMVEVVVEVDGGRKAFLMRAGVSNSLGGIGAKGAGVCTLLLKQFNIVQLQKFV